MLNNKQELFFDIGFSNRYYYSKKDDKEKQIINHFRHIISFSAPQWIILSHWHMDHVSGYECINANLCGLKNKDYNVFTHCFWITPHVRLLKNKPSVRILRLAYYAKVNHTLWMVDQDDRSLPVVPLQPCNNKIVLWQGMLKDKRRRAGDVANDTGLLLQIRNDIDFKKAQFVLLPGDCSYERFPVALKTKPYQLLITPHHGSAHTTPDLRAGELTTSYVGEPGSSGKKTAQAVLSVGVNTYSHPAPEHMRALLENGFHLVFTLDCCYLETEIVFGSAIPNLKKVSFAEWCDAMRRKNKFKRLLKKCECCKDPDI